ncbi:MAG: hypothetical protein AB7V43_09595, partial [Acidimicrobiia bacterium]
ERRDEWVWCLDGDRMIEPTASEHHEFFGRADSESFECTPPPRVLDAARLPGQAGLGTCSNGDEEFSSMFETMDLEPVDTPWGTVDTVCVRQTFDTGVAPNASGGLDVHGEFAVTDYFIGEQGMPVMVKATKVTRRPSPVGDVNYRESYTLVLRDPEPMR